MADTPRLRALSTEALESLPEEVAPLAEQLNTFVSDTSNFCDAINRELQVKDYILKTVEFTVQEPVWTSAVFGSSWVDYGTPYETAAYTIDPSGRVSIRGLVKNGTVGNAIFTLPAGYRPAKQRLCSTYSFAGATRVDVHTNGDVVATNGHNAFYSLENLSFQALNPAAPTPPTTGGWPLSVYHGFSTVHGLECIRTINKSSPNDPPGHARFDWSVGTKNKLSLRNVYGLRAGQTYQCTLRIYGS